MKLKNIVRKATKKMLVTILFLLIALAIVVYISYPLLHKSRLPVFRKPSEQTGRKIVSVVSDESTLELFAERDSTYMALADLDFDYECGKVSDKDYQRLRQELLRDIVFILSRIETDSTNLDVEKHQEQIVQRYRLLDENVVEAEIARYKKLRNPFSRRKRVSGEIT